MQGAAVGIDRVVAVRHVLDVAPRDVELLLREPRLPDREEVLRLDLCLDGAEAEVFVLSLGVRESVLDFSAHVFFSGGCSSRVNGEEGSVRPRATRSSVTHSGGGAPGSASMW